MSKFTYRNWQAFLVLLSLFVLAMSFYFQYVKGMQPCPLCLMQRLCVGLLFMFCLIAVRINTIKRARIVAALQMIIAVAGLFFVIRQLWLQSLPLNETPVCIPGVDILIRYFPWDDLLYAFFWGSPDCGEVTWYFLGLSMPAWAGLYFLFMLVASGIAFWFLSHTLGQIRKKK